MAVASPLQNAICLTPIVHDATDSAMFQQCSAVPSHSVCKYISPSISPSRLPDPVPPGGCAWAVRMLSLHRAHRLRPPVDGESSIPPPPTHTQRGAEEEPMTRGGESQTDEQAEMPSGPADQSAGLARFQRTHGGVRQGQQQTDVKVLVS